MSLEASEKHRNQNHSDATYIGVCHGGSCHSYLDPPKSHCGYEVGVLSRSRLKFALHRWGVRLFKCVGRTGASNSVQLQRQCGERDRQKCTLLLIIFSHSTPPIGHTALDIPLKGDRGYRDMVAGTGSQGSTIPWTPRHLSTLCSHALLRLNFGNPLHLSPVPASEINRYAIVNPKLDPRCQSYQMGKFIRDVE